jgi:hypothetical protein
MRAARNTRFLLELTAKPGTDPIRSLRRGLKFLGRACGLRAIRVEELHHDDHSPVQGSLHSPEREERR